MQATGIVTGIVGHNKDTTALAHCYSLLYLGLLCPQTYIAPVGQCPRHVRIGGYRQRVLVSNNARLACMCLTHVGVALEGVECLQELHSDLFGECKQA